MREEVEVALGVAVSDAEAETGALSAPASVRASRPVKVALIGAGPGDPGLLTVRGRELLQWADVVVYDYLANDALLALAPDDAERIPVGKKGFAHHPTQLQINQLLVQCARQLQQAGGGLIVRLKGGDPFVFGRGGEEALALAQAHIPFEIVPGVTSGVAAPAYAGIPVTHRTLSSSVTFVTGHEDPTKNASAIDWMALARLAARGGTLCFYMGMHNLGMIAQRLMGEGLAADTPAALVQWGTLPAQRTMIAPLSVIESRSRDAGFGAPSIILVGPVATLRDQLAWYERLPLFGRRVVVTRSRSQAPTFTKRLHDLGAEVLAFPAIECVPPESYGSLDAAIDRLNVYDWIVFTSVNGVQCFFERLQDRAPKGGVVDARALAGMRIATIGPATAAHLRRFGLVADAVPTSYRGEAVYAAMQEVCAATGSSLKGAHVLLPRAQVARQALPDLLRAAGAQVDVVPAYRTVIPRGDTVRALIDALTAGQVDALTFTSSSTVRNLLELLGEGTDESAGRGDACAADHDSMPVDKPMADDGARTVRDLLARCELFSIGPVTSATLREAGLERIHEATIYTIDGLIACLCAFYGADRR